MERVTGIGGLFFRARDPETLRRWYDAHLGITPTPVDYDQRPWHQEAGPTIIEGFPADTTYFGPGHQMWMVNFRVRDLAAIVAHLQSTGVDVTVDPQAYPNGRFARLQDPEGNPIELWEPQERQVPAATSYGPPRTWETERLAARPAVRADAQTVFEHYASDVEVARFMTWRPHRTVAETTDFLLRCERAWADGSAHPWTLWMRGTGHFAGLLEIRVRSHAVDLGYALARRWRGQGLMREAVTWIVRWALAQPRIYRVWATCDVENIASARLLERVGMQQEAILRRWLVHPNVADTPRDCLCYAIVKGSGAP